MQRLLVAPRLNAALAQRLARIYSEHVSLVRATVRGRGVPESAVDDVVHDVFLTVYRRLPRRDEAVPLRRWLIGVARNVAFSHRRAAARRSRRHRRVDTTAHEAPFDAEDLDARRAWEVVSAFVGTLPDEQGEAFLLCAMHGLPASEVAAALRCSPHTIASRLRLARTKFARRFPEARSAGDTKALLAAARRGARPRSTQRRKALAALMADLSLAATPVASVAATTTMWTWLGSVAAASVLTWGIVNGPRPGPNIDRAAPATDGRVVDDAALVDRRGGERGSDHDLPAVLGRGTDTTSREGAADRSVPASSVAAVTADRAPGVVAAADVPRGASARTPRRGAPRAAASPRDAAGSSAPKRDGLREQARLLRDARRAVAERRLSKAAQLLSAHADRFPNGVLDRERVRVEVALQCALGHRDRAASLLDRLGGIAPDGDACAKLARGRSGS